MKTDKTQVKNVQKDQILSPNVKVTLDCNQNDQSTVNLDEKDVDLFTKGKNGPFKPQPEGEALQGEYFNDNWLHKLLCYTWYGRVINLSALAVIAYFTFFIRPNFYEAIFDKVFPSGKWLQLWIFGWSTEIALHLVILLFVYPMSRLSKSPKYYWVIGTIGAVAITAIGLIDYRGERTNALIRFAIAVEFTRLTMKAASLLVECYRNEKTYEETNILTVLYFLFAPTLKYKSKYPKTPRIRLFSLFYCVSWLFVLTFGMAQLFYDVLVPLTQIDLMTVDLYGLLLCTVYIALLTPLVGGICIIFAFFELWNNMWGEVLRFRDRKFMGPPSDFLDPVKAIRAFNIVVTDFLSEYIYKPVHEKTKSRLMALTAVFMTSITHHELCLSFTLTQILFVNLVTTVLAGPFLIKRKPNVIIKYARLIILAAFMPFYLYLHVIEYFAWNTSSIPNIQDESKIRLLPLSTGYILRAMLQPNSTGSYF